MKNRDLVKFGKRLKEFRLNRNMKQQELADRCAMNKKTVSAIENGYPVTTDNMIKILNILGLKEAFIEVIPELPISPILMRKLKGKPKERVR